MAVSRETKEQIRLGVKDSWLVGLGLIPLGLAFGLLISQTGFAWWWAPIFSTIVYAGSMEFLVIDMVVSGLGPFSSALTAFMVNFRHIFYGLTFPRDVVPRGLPTAYVTYGLTDEAYAGLVGTFIELGPEAVVLVNLSGRGDKDMHTAARWFGLVDDEAEGTPSDGAVVTGGAESVTDVDGEGGVQA
mgnify:CR=1 FL=1